MSWGGLLWPDGVAADEDVVAHGEDFDVVHFDGAFEGKSSKGGAAAAAEAGGEIPVGFVDEAAAEGLTEDDAATFDEEGGDLSLGQFFEHVGKLHAGENKGAIFEFIREDDGILRQIAAAGEDDAPGLEFVGL